MMNGKKAGHGLLMRHGNDFFILTAAHVAVDFVKDEGKKVELQWHPWEDSADLLVATVENVYLPKKYVEDGSNDVGLIKINYDSSTMKVHLTLYIDKSPSNAGVVVGEGASKVRLRGERDPSLQTEGSRHTVHAPFKPGMSGLPLFLQANGKQVSLVHGNTKHRGGHEAAAAMDRPLPFLYADSIVPTLTMVCVNKICAKALLVAKDLLPEIADERDPLSGSEGTIQDYKDYAVKLGGALGMNEENIKDTMMKLLADKCFKGMEQTVEIFEVVIVATNAENVELVDKLSQGHKSATTIPATPPPEKRQRGQHGGEESSEH